MILEAESDAAFDVNPDARSRAAGHICPGSSDNTQFNAPVHVLSKTAKGVMGSAAEAEVAALHMNAHKLMPMRDCLHMLNHPQPPTRIKTDNVTAKGFVQSTVKQKRSKGCDWKCWWLKDRVKEFNITWASGKTIWRITTQSATLDPVIQRQDQPGRLPFKAPHWIPSFKGKANLSA